MVYVDDDILIGKTASDINAVISKLRLLYDLTDEGQIEDYLGIHVDHLNSGKIKLSQPHLIDQICKDVHLSHNAKHRPPLQLAPVSSSAVNNPLLSNLTSTIVL